MKSFKEMLAETVDKPKSPDEQNFLDKHIVDKRDHPVAPDDQFSGEIKGKKKKKREADREDGQDKEVYEEAEEVIAEGVLADLASIVKKKSIGQIKFTDGKKQKVDLTTASMILSMHKQLNGANKKKIEGMLDDSKKFMQIVQFAMTAGK
jgi:hypothetical protein|tara:strand:- start:2623 stop:3072 length:450 start_codon:yes stop_codon:yes gene_type:complete